MKISKPIVLVGMMGTGKTTIGRRIANKLNLKFYDTDKLIEEKEGLSIVDIFDFKGEEYFRNIEIEVINQILSYGNTVISTGGGSFLTDEIRDKIKDSALSIWLDSDAQSIQKRVSRKRTRPLLIDNDNLETIEKMLEERNPIYAKADIHLQANDMDSYYITDVACSRIKKHFANDG